MIRPIAISLSPNTEADDSTLALRLLTSPASWSNASSIQQAESELAALFPGHEVALTSSGRQALKQILIANRITTADQEIIIQAFTCSAVPAAVLFAGATPIYADIEPNTFNLNPHDVAAKVTPRTRAIIVQHTFGIPGPLYELKKIAQQHNLLLIEDGAHALGALYQGVGVGMHGDVAFFSFGRDKVLSSLFGGAVVSTNKKLIGQIRDYQQKLSLPPRWWILQQLLHPILFRIIIPTYFSGLGKAALVAFQKLRLLSKAVENNEKKGIEPRHLKYRLSPALARLLLQQLSKLQRYNQHRRDVAKRYQESLRGTKGVTAPVVSTGDDPIWLRFPILVNHPDIIRRRANQRHILLGDWYNSPVAPKDIDLKTFHYTLGSCPVAEHVSKRIVNLPTHPRLSNEDVTRVIDFIKEEAL